MNMLYSSLPIPIRRLGRIYDKIREIVPYTDEEFIRRRFYQKLGYALCLEKPRTFSEKLQWMKLYDHNDLYTKLADKFLVRNYVKERVGPYILNDLIGVFEKVEDIHFDELPSSFILKTNHGSTWNIICEKKKRLDIELCKHTLNCWLKQNYYNKGREWCYKNIKPCIVCEKYLGPELLDYKFMCFNGVAKCVKVDIDRFTNHTRNIYDMDWNLLPVTIGFKNAFRKITKPTNFSEMITVAEKLSKGLKFVRVDLYSIDNSVIFGEMTLYPGSGVSIITPRSYDRELGSYLQL